MLTTKRNFHFPAEIRSFFQKKATFSTHWLRIKEALKWASNGCLSSWECKLSFMRQSKVHLSLLLGPWRRFKIRFIICEKYGRRTFLDVKLRSQDKRMILSEKLDHRKELRPVFPSNAYKRTNLFSLHIKKWHKR